MGDRLTMSHKLIDKLSDLSDISGTPSDGQVLTYQSSSADWQAVAASGEGGKKQTIFIRNPTATYFDPNPDFFNDSPVIPLDEIGVIPAGGVLTHKSLPSGLYRQQLTWRMWGVNTSSPFQIRYNHNCWTNSTWTPFMPVWVTWQSGVQDYSLVAEVRTMYVTSIINAAQAWETRYTLEIGGNMSHTAVTSGQVQRMGWKCVVTQLGEYDATIPLLSSSSTTQ